MRVLLTGYSDLQAILRSVNEGEVFRFVNKPWSNESYWAEALPLGCCETERERVGERVTTQRFFGLRREQQQLGADRVGVLVADLGAEEDDPLAQQALVDVVVEDVHAPAAVELGAGVQDHEADPSPKHGQNHGSCAPVRAERISRVAAGPIRPRPPP